MQDRELPPGADEELTIIMADLAEDVPADRPAPRRRRLPRAAVGLGILALLLAAAGFVGVYYFRQPGRGQTVLGRDGPRFPQMEPPSVTFDEQFAPQSLRSQQVDFGPKQIDEFLPLTEGDAGGIRVSTLNGPWTWIPFAAWSADGKRVYLVSAPSGAQKLCELSVPDFTVLREVKLGSSGSYYRMTVAQPGLVLADGGWVLLIDPETLRPKNRLAINSSSIAAAPRLPMAFVVDDAPGGSTIRSVDLVEGKVVAECRANFPRGALTVTPDGKYLLDASDGFIHRFAIEGRRLRYEQGTTEQLKAYPKVAVSADSRYVGVAGELGKSPVVRVYAVGDLRTPVTSIASAATAVAVDPLTRDVYVAGGQERYVISVYSPDATRRTRIKLPGVPGTGTLLVHPAGRKVLVVRKDNFHWLDFSGREPR